MGARSYFFQPEALTVRPGLGSLTHLYVALVAQVASNNRADPVLQIFVLAAEFCREGVKLLLPQIDHDLAFLQPRAIGRKAVRFRPLGKGEAQCLGAGRTRILSETIQGLKHIGLQADPYEGARLSGALLFRVITS